MEIKQIIEILVRLQEEMNEFKNIAIELKALSEKDPEFVKKLDEFITHCKEERER